MMTRGLGRFFLVAVSFCGGIAAHSLYLRWNPAAPAGSALPESPTSPHSVAPIAAQEHRVNFAPLTPVAPLMAAAPLEANAEELAVLIARDVEKIRAHTGKQAKVRGRVFRVGHSAKSNTYFINFGPSREAMTAVIFSSAVELFEKNRMAPKSFENKELELTGFIKDHPQYGLEMILENPKQVRVIH
jgi:hypothetical protein